MARRTVKAKDLDPETDVGIGDDEDEEKPPPGDVHYEVWEGHIYSEGTRRDWPPRKRVRGWIGRETATGTARVFNETEADQAALGERHISKYYVVVKVKTERTLDGY